MGKSSSTIESTMAYTRKRGPFSRILEPAYLMTDRWMDGVLELVDLGVLVKGMDAVRT